jgi:hypothetical protein
MRCVAPREGFSEPPRYGQLQVMTANFREVVAQVIDWLQQDHRVSDRALKRRFGVDEEYLADLRNELVNVRRVAIEQNDTMLVWVGQSHTGSAAPSVQSPLTRQ